MSTGTLPADVRPAPPERWIMLHMIEETGQRAGHIDILRELLDGATGE